MDSPYVTITRANPHTVKTIYPRHLRTYSLSHKKQNKIKLTPSQLLTSPITPSHVEPSDADISSYYSCHLPCHSPSINIKPHAHSSSHTHLKNPPPSPTSFLCGSSIFTVLSFQMARNYTYATLCFLLIFLSVSSAALVKQQPMVLKYHNGALLKGKITVNLIWYGKFTPIQRSIIVDFIQSLGSTRAPRPSAASWWRTTEKYKGGSSTLVVANQILHENYPFGKILKNSHIIGLGSRPTNGINSINVVLTAQDVAVEGFCMRCGSHGSGGRARGSSRVAYIWVGNSATQCPGQCAWPFYQPMYGPQTPPLVAPNGDVGVDGMIINLATLLAGTVTNPFKDGYFQGPPTAPLEAVSACTGVFGAGAYPGYPGQVLVDKATGASYNANGVNGRKFLLPAMWDPQTSACSTLV